MKYWSLGNELYGPWQVAQMTKEDYAKKAFQWAKALKYLDPSIKLILAGELGHTSWDAHIIRECIKPNAHGLVAGEASSLVDLYSIHVYTACEDHLQNATCKKQHNSGFRFDCASTDASSLAPLHVEREIEVCAALIDAARFENNIPCTVPVQKICLDEWNIWNFARAPGDLGAEEQ